MESVEKKKGYEYSESSDEEFIDDLDTNRPQVVKLVDSISTGTGPKFHPLNTLRIGSSGKHRS